jgi:hypothetical protein
MSNTLQSNGNLVPSTAGKAQEYLENIDAASPRYLNKCW